MLKPRSNQVYGPCGKVLLEPGKSGENCQDDGNAPAANSPSLPVANTLSVARVLERNPILPNGFCQLERAVVSDLYRTRTRLNSI